MVTICQLSKVNYSLYDEVWAIVRSLKYASPRIKHVPELSPSWALFKLYMRLREEGQWNEDTFRNIYVPQFLKEMRGNKQQQLLNELYATDRHICLVCFCPEEELCHRSIVGGMLQGAGLDVKGLGRDYGYYYDRWKNGVPGASGNNVASEAIEEKKHVADYNKDVTFLYESDTPEENLFDDGIPTLCATGRRPKDLCMYDMAKYREFVSDLSEMLYNDFYAKLGIRRFISGAAQGFDQMFFWAVERMKKMHGLTDVQNVVFVAFEGQELRWSKTGCFSQAEYWMMIRQADKVAVVCKDNTVDSLFARNHAMCDCSDYCLALYPDNTWRVNRGGTAECMRYAVFRCNMFRLGYRIDDMGLHMGAVSCKSVVL